MKARLFAAALALALAAAAPQVLAGDTPSPEGARAYIVNLNDGDTVTSPVTVVFGLSGMGVAPAGTEAANTGHHHLLVDTTLTEDEMDEGIPTDDQHVHFGKGQTEVTIELAPGSHTLQLVLGDKDHIPHNPPVMSEPITITVQSARDPRGAAARPGWAAAPLDLRLQAGTSWGRPFLD
jgi:hypothetical protein